MCENHHTLEGPMLMQARINGGNMWLTLSVAMDDDRKALRSQLQAKHLPWGLRGGRRP